MNIGIVCYASVGGSGIVATELGKALARRGHQVHIISTDPPFRLGDFQAGLRFHQVHTPTYPLLRNPPYLLALANRIVQVAREFELDIVHAHYAVPLATAGFLARQVLTSKGARAPRIVTTLHGTDITLVGSAPSFSEIVAFSIEASDSVTAVSASLRASTYDRFEVQRDIQVIPNFVNTQLYQRSNAPGLRRRLAGADPATRLIVHVSNFRPVKRIDSVIEVFARIRRVVPARLLLVGDGPELAPAQQRASELGIGGDVLPLGEQEEVTPLLSVGDVFLLPSEQESFGLAALEAMACELPVVASNVGGLPEVVEHGVTGFLHPPDALDEMAASALKLLHDHDLQRQMGRAARQRACDRFDVDRVVPEYEALYRGLVG